MSEEKRKLEKKLDGIFDGTERRVDFSAAFPDLTAEQSDTVFDIMQGKAVHRNIMHNWAEGKKFATVTYKGRIESVEDIEDASKSKKKKKEDKHEYVICYWTQSKLR